MRDWSVFIFVHLVIPIIGIVFYLILTKRMKQEEIPMAPVLQLFFIFGVYGVMIILILTSLIWKWSGMASIGAFASISIGPIIMGYIGYSTYKIRRISKYHELTYHLSIAYIGFVLILIVGSLIYGALK